MHPLPPMLQSRLAVPFIPFTTSDDTHMTMAFTIFKLLIVLFFLYKFIRGGRLVWGIGLMTVTTALLIDTLTVTLGHEVITTRLGLFYEVLRGCMLAGGALWLFGLLRPQTITAPATIMPQSAAAPYTPPPPAPPAWTSTTQEASTPLAVDRRMLYEQIRYRLSPEELLDALFDVGINENDVFNPTQDMTQIIVHLMDVAEAQGKSGDLALAVERILTDVSPETLPRLEKLSPDTPPAILRYFLLLHYSQEQLSALAAQLDITSELFTQGSKKSYVRQMLLHLYRRNRIAELVSLMQTASEE